MSSIGVMHVELRIAWSKSLKDKRTVLKSIKAKLRQKFNISIIESDYQEKWKSSILSIALITDQKKNTARQLEIIEEFIINKLKFKIARSKKNMVQSIIIKLPELK